MTARPRYPTDCVPTVEVSAALGRFDDFATVVAPQRPGARGCWCLSCRDGSVPSEQRPDYMRAACGSDPGPGVLAYVGQVPAGWCSIAPRAHYPRLLRSRTIPILDDRDAWCVACFVVRAGFRGHGLMHTLLAGAVAHADEHGAEIVEGYPVRTGGGRVDTISGYVGTVELFERAGFSFASDTRGHSGGRPRVVMRRRLRSPE